MNALFEQIKNIIGAIPLSQKIMMGAVLLLVFFGCMGLYLYGQKTSYQPLYASLSTEDAASIADELSAQNVPFQIQGGGTMILVPAERVYDLRLSMASSGLPKGGGVGFEIFDETDFGTTEFVQKLNYQRALQGELARTIKEFNEVNDARVMIVMAEDSVFIEEEKPASASVLLKLRSGLSKSKVEAVVNLVAGSVEDLDTGNVTVVDTDGNVLSKKNEEDGQEEVADTKLEYKLTYENNLARQIQTMLERIVGSGKAIVRVAADMNFDQVDLSEEIYDPEAQVIRSMQKTAESSGSSTGDENGISSVNPVTAGGGTGGVNSQQSETSEKEIQTVNYEISRTVRRTLNPVAEIERLSVAAVLDGTYITETDKSGNQTRTYVPRTEAEIEQFTRIVQNAMGYSSDREDQVSVESFPFDTMNEMGFEDAPLGTDWPAIFRRYGHLAGYAVLILAAFMFLVKPIVRTVQQISVQSQQVPLTVKSENTEALPEADIEDREALPAPSEMGGREKATFLARQDLDRTTEQIRGWLSEAS